METTQAEPAAREAFYHLLSQVPEAEAVWEARQATLRTWRAHPRFQPFWPSIDQMLVDDFASFRRRGVAMKEALEAVRGLEGYDFDIWHEQREYDRKHDSDHLP